MRRSIIIAVVAACVGIGMSMPAPANAQGDILPKLRLCAGATTSMSPRRAVLITLEYVGQPRKKGFVGVRRYRGAKGTLIGIALPRCWVVLPIRPGTKHHRPVLCSVIKKPYAAGDTGPCPAPGKLGKWWTYKFQLRLGGTTSPPQPPTENPSGKYTATATATATATVNGATATVNCPEPALRPTETASGDGSGSASQEVTASSNVSQADAQKKANAAAAALVPQLQPAVNAAAQQDAENNARNTAAGKCEKRDECFVDSFSIKRDPGTGLVKASWSGHCWYNHTGSGPTVTAVKLVSPDDFHWVGLAGDDQQAFGPQPVGVCWHLEVSTPYSGGTVTGEACSST